MTLAMSGVNPEDAGLASGLVNTTVQVGGAIGLAVLATLAAGRTRRVDRARGAAVRLPPRVPGRRRRAASPRPCVALLARRGPQRCVYSASVT